MIDDLMKVRTYSIRIIFFMQLVLHVLGSFLIVLTSRARGSPNKNSFPTLPAITSSSRLHATPVVFQSCKTVYPNIYFTVKAISPSVVNK